MCCFVPCPVFECTGVHPSSRTGPKGRANCGCDVARFRPVEQKARKGCDTATTPKINLIRGLAARATTPLLPDDYLKLLNPLWSARELRGEIVEVRGETEDSATVTIRPGVGFPRSTGLGNTSASGSVSTGVGTGVVFTHLSPPPRRQAHHHHRQGDSRRFPLHACGARCETRNDRSLGGPKGRLRTT
jgi:hypothetical protein